ncbi:hypothetical protein PU629_12595 [Pullulanibacillus sp. KACC 23026]|uniref:TcaA 3rd/4th domain-containing protein n=1 Tax=Pullulanibacillus sp. KACC 23026 TaxID=3028315 RepID=UPI0023B00C76|nr:hypothetical protein [Pullulanibacillus sp. KACC 23026]WEG11016.1 hypothetical protein PU629_12595 [Pullulanibacillus sp. KACC 23026]
MQDLKKVKKQGWNSRYGWPATLLGVITIGFVLIVSAGCSRNQSHSNSSNSNAINKNLIERFEADIQSGKSADLKAILIPENSNMTITDQTIQDLIQYVKKHPDYLRQQVSILKEQEKVGHAIDLRLAKASSTKKQPSKKNNHEEKLDLSVLSKGDFSYTHYKGKPYHIYMRPHQLHLNFNKQGIKLWINGKSYPLQAKAQSFSLDNLPADQYTIKVQKKYDYTTLTSEKIVNLFNNNNQTAPSSIDINLTGADFHIISQQKNVNILMNGKDLGLKADYADPTSIEPGPFFGPFPVDQNIHIQGEKTYPWGINKSKTYVITKDTLVMDLEPSPFYSDTTKKQIVNTINTFAKQRWQALTKQTPSLLTVATSSAKQTIETAIQKDEAQGDSVIGQLLGTKIDFDMAELNQVSSNQYTYRILVQIHTKEAKIKGNKPSAQLNNQKEGVFLTLCYDTKLKAWIITKIESANYTDRTSPFIVSTDFK